VEEDRLYHVYFMFVWGIGKSGICVRIAGESLGSF
jgi:hypothetical protein